MQIKKNITKTTKQNDRKLACVGIDVANIVDENVSSQKIEIINMLVERKRQKWKLTGRSHSVLFQWQKRRKNNIENMHFVSLLRVSITESSKMHVSERHKENKKEKTLINGLMWITC